HVAAITHLVASSIPNLEISQVTVVDDRGRLLSSGDDSHEFGLTTNQFEYTRKLEQTYIDRIERLLSPLVGLNGVRAQVTAELDFTRTESTQETFNPDLPALRSEQNIIEQTQGGQIDSGIPGALSNEPPGQAIAPENATAQGGQAAALAQEKSKSKKRSIRNFELDKTISHTQRGLGGIRRLSIAVVLDVNESTDAKGKKSKVPFTDDELIRFTSLVKEAVGFNGIRGDTVNVINLPFQPAEIMAAVPEEPFWEKSWFWSVLKQVAAAVFIIFLILGILRPMMKSLSVPPKKVIYSENGEELTEDQLLLSGKGPRLPKPTTYEDNLNMAKSLAQNEPKRVAQVVKSWIEGS
ncbi:MAG: flagellar basal-body MS-ring/collar protein FliF, partial [Gammaproteobacteria bacterium]|nr:flagellar basal-body MS-ring/collar protein FliF [Gammaproteobacteria bacterium]